MSVRAVRSTATAPARTQAAAPPKNPQWPAHSKAYVHKHALAIATAATHWKYDTAKAHRTGGTGLGAALETARGFDRNHKGICVDMAVEASERFTKAGIESRVVGGHDFTTGRNHAWVEYREGGNSGRWVRFDPTAAASGKKAVYAFNNKWLRCGKPTMVLGEWVPKDHAWENHQNGDTWKFNSTRNVWVDKDGFSVPGKDI